jgi:hypothetical protein
MVDYLKDHRMVSAETTGSHTMLVSYTSDTNEDGVISGVIHVSVARCVHKNREKERYLEVNAWRSNEPTENHDHYGILYRQCCLKVEAYDEESGRLIRSWNL